MFDISFSELMVIAVVALLVIGPEKLPKLARTLGAYTGRMQRFVAQVKDEVNREMRFEELQKLQQEVNSAALNAEASILAEVRSVEDAIAESPKTALTSPVKAKKKSTPKKTLAAANEPDTVAKPKTQRKRAAKPPVASS